MADNETPVTALTDDELKEFNEKIEHGKLLPMREILKDTLDIIHFTVKYYLKYSVPRNENAGKDSTHELLIDSWQKIISNAKSQVDEMADDELAKIAKHDNCAQDAFNLVKMHIPVGMYQSRLTEDREFPGLSAILGELKLRGYLRKISDIYSILNTPTERYMGSTIEYFSKSRCKEYFSESRCEELLGELSAVRGTAHCTSDSESSSAKGATRRMLDDLRDVIYNTGLRHPYFVYLYEKDQHHEQSLDEVIGEPDVVLKWTDENVKGINKDEFFDFLTKHESDISAYARLKPSFPQLNAEEKDEICRFFVRWFVKEQQSYKE